MHLTKTNICTYFSKMLVFLFLSGFVMQPATAYSVVEVNPVDTPHGAVILIVDGLGSSYAYPEFTPYALDGSVIGKVNASNMSLLFNENCRVLDVRAPQTYTEAGHSVLVTGYSKALSDSVQLSGTTIYDVAHEYDYLTFGIMQKGDFWSLCDKQDVIVHDASNSVNEPEMVIETNIAVADAKSASIDVAALMQENILSLQPELEKYDEGSQQRYDSYDNWAIESGIDVMDLMESEYPDQPYILTINVGAVDTAGHYKKDSGYIATIEGIDAACMSLYEKCTENNIAFIFTADHGMAFAGTDARGGHQSDKYARTDEAQRVPFVISAVNVAPSLIKEEYGQEDIAPTILEILDLPGELRLSDGEAIRLKEHANIRVITPDEGTVILKNEDSVLAELDHTGDCIFRGLEIGDDYTISFIPADNNGQSLEKDVSLIKSETIDLVPAADVPETDISLQNPRHLIGGALIGIVNITGLAIIRRILKE
jgi:bisphosphoglycerate-independent phosphoglycerate mutase (AlkP superfamily)